MGEMDIAFLAVTAYCLAQDVYQKLARDMSYRPFDEFSFPVDECAHRPSSDFTFNPQQFYDNKMRMKRC